MLVKGKERGSKDRIELVCRPHLHWHPEVIAVHVTLECQRVRADLSILFHGPYIIFTPPHYSREVHEL